MPATAPSPPPLTASSRRPYSRLPDRRSGALSPIPAAFSSWFGCVLGTRLCREREFGVRSLIRATSISQWTSS